MTSLGAQIRFCKYGGEWAYPYHSQNTVIRQDVPHSSSKFAPKHWLSYRQARDMSTLFKKVSPQVNFAQEEHEVLKIWERLDAFEESNRRRKDGEPFVFYDGPPFATGTPHYGHLLAGTIK